MRVGGPGTLLPRTDYFATSVLDAGRLTDGKPMRYRKIADGRYALWSIGFDGRDDRGKSVLEGEKPEDTKFNNEEYAGEWVWDFPAD